VLGAYLEAWLLFDPERAVTELRLTEKAQEVFPEIIDAADRTAAGRLMRVGHRPLECPQAIPK
jgi:hypothetical protein